MSVPIEPHGDIREMTATWRQMFLALREHGFTDEQATQLLAAFIQGVGGRR